MSWSGICRIIEFSLYDVDGTVLYRQENFYNILHREGEEFILRALFTGGKTNNSYIPENYYIGLDNRGTLKDTDTLYDLVDEPTGGGYSRASVPSLGSFDINLENDVFVAYSPLVGFTSSSAKWGPVSNIFLSTTGDNTGYLIASAPLSSSIEVNVGQTITARIGMQLKRC